MTNWKGLKGGSKNLALRQHRAEIMAYYRDNGEKATRKKYAIVSDTTWVNFLNPRKVTTTKLTKADRATHKAEIAEQGLREVKREVQDLKDRYSKFVPLVAEELNNKFFKPLLKGKIELPPELEYKEKPDPLRITNITMPRSRVRITPKRPRIK